MAEVVRPYETIMVFATTADQEASTVLGRLTSIIQSEGGRIDTHHDWGVRRLAYPIHKQSQGHFHLLEYHAAPQIVREVERNLRITEGVLRYLSVQQEHTGLPEPKGEAEHGEMRGDVPLRDLHSGPRRRGPAAEDEGMGEMHAEAEGEETPAEVTDE